MRNSAEDITLDFTASSQPEYKELEEAIDALLDVYSIKGSGKVNVRASGNGKVVGAIAGTVVMNPYEGTDIIDFGLLPTEKRGEKDVGTVTLTSPTRVCLTLGDLEYQINYTHK